MKKLALITIMTALTSLGPVKAMVPATHLFDCPQPKDFTLPLHGHIFGATSPQGTLYTMPYPYIHPSYIPGYTIQSLDHIIVYKHPTLPPSANSTFYVQCHYILKNSDGTKSLLNAANPNTQTMFTGTQCTVIGGTPLSHRGWDCTAGKPCQVTCQ